MKALIPIFLMFVALEGYSQNVWEEVFKSGGISKKIVCLNENRCYVVSTAGAFTNIHFSQDAGASWELLNSINELEVQDMSVPDSNNIYIPFNNGKTYHSIDAGKSFTNFRLDSVHSFPYIIMSNELIGAITNAYIIPNIFYILITKDGWKTFEKLALDIENIRYSFHYPNFINDSMLYAIVRVYDQREPHVQYYTNHSFMKLNINTLEYELIYIDHLSGIRDLFVLNEQILFACGTSNTLSGGTCHDAIYKSTDGGVTWRRVLDLYSDRTKFNEHEVQPFGLQSIAFKDSLTGIAVGQFGKIVYTYDGGESWTYENDLPPRLGGDESNPPTMLIRYSGTIPIIAAFNGSIHRLQEDNLAPGQEHKYSISGRVWEGEKGQSGIPISLDTFRVTMTDKDGYYRFGNLKEGNYQVRALNKYFDDANPTYYYKPFDYTPLKYNIELTSDTTGFDFNAEDLRTFYKVEGYIVDDKGQGVPDIFLRTGSSTTTTDASGRFEFPKIESRLTFDVIPYSEELAFSPSSHRINLITGDTTDLLFTATPATSVWESANSSSLILHPNPASEYIEINAAINPTVNRRVDEGSEIKIFNTLGECVIELPDVQHLGDVGHLQRIDISIFLEECISNKSIFYKSSDGGDTFEKSLMEGIYTIQNIEMFDKDMGVMANLSILITKNGWETYEQFKIDSGTKNFRFSYPKFINDSILLSIVYNTYALPAPYFLLHLNINKLNYQLNFIDSLYSISDFFILDVKNMYACGKSHPLSGGTGRDAIYKSTDSGVSWRRVLDLYTHRSKFHDHYIPPFGLQSISFKDSLTGIAVGQFGKIVYTYDGGESWIYENDLPPKLGGGQSNPATMIIRYSGNVPIIAAFNGSIHRLIKDNLLPDPDNKFSISGKVWDGNEGQAGIQIINGYGVTMTDKDGYYRFWNLKEGNYQVRAMNKYYDGKNLSYYIRPYLYHPEKYEIELTSDTTGFDFNAEDIRSNYAIMGIIKDNKGNLLTNMEVQIGEYSVKTDSTGNYIYYKAESKEYFIKPIDEAYTFAPTYYDTLITSHSFTLDFTATPATSVWEIANSSSIILHPNPASEYIEINSAINPTVNRRVDETAEIKIFNTLGECVIELPDVQHLGDVGHLQRIDVSNLPRGVYFVRFGNKFEKFMVVR
jgi:photosystem II stability/assembly factor-like uncharacterized protein